MLSAEGCAARRKRLWGALPGPCDALVLGDPQHLIYFANYAQSPFVFRSAEAGGLLILEPDRATLVTDNIAEAFCDRASVDEVLAPIWYNGTKSAPLRQGIRERAAIDRLKQLRPRRLGVEMASVPAGVIEAVRSSQPGIELIDLDPVIRPLRRAKDPDELAVLRRSMRAGEAAQAEALAKVKPGMTELDVFRIVQQAAIVSAGEPVIVYGDFVSGPKCATERGGSPTSRTIERGDLILLDFSVVIFGYRGDFTNTFAVGSEPTARQRELFDACVGALALGEAMLRPGVPCRDVDAALRAFMANLGLERYYLSHTGHGLGLGHPEPPYLVPESTESLMVGDVVALEPGLYIEGQGGMRFEHNYLITQDGYEVLSHHEIRISTQG